MGLFANDPPQTTSAFQTESFDGFRKPRTIGLRQNSDRMMNKPRIDRDNLQESHGRSPGQTDGSPPYQRHVKRVTRIMRRDSGQQDIVLIDVQHHAGAAFPSLHVREGNSTDTVSPTLNPVINGVAWRVVLEKGLDCQSLPIEIFWIQSNQMGQVTIQPQLIGEWQRLDSLF